MTINGKLGALECIKKNGTNADWRILFQKFHDREIYEAYLLSNAWNHKRQQRLHQDQYRCIACLRVNGLNVHHVTYKNLGDEPMSDLRTYCVSCHAKEHPGSRLEQVVEAVERKRNQSLHLQTIKPN